jgi:hypothetical protein
VSPYQDDWDDRLTAVEFAYNNSQHAGTKFTPFHLNGQEPRLPLGLHAGQGETADGSAEQFASKLAADLARATENLTVAKARQARNFNAKRRQHEFKVGDKVMLRREFTDGMPGSVVLPGTTSKLEKRKWGPFQVLRLVGDGAVELELPEQWKMHPVVNERFVEPYRDGTQWFPEREEVAPEPESVDGEEHYQVEGFRNHRFRGQRLEYLVKWVGYPETRNTWQAVTQLRGDLSPDAMSKFVEDYKRSRQLPEDFEIPQLRRSTRARRGS